MVSVSGDRSFGQYLAEFNTVVKYGMDIVHVLINSGELGKVYKEQRDGVWSVWQMGLHNPFADYAELCGGARGSVSAKGISLPVPWWQP